MGWKDNPIMEWRDPRVGSPTYNTWVKISDHNRSPLSITVERIEKKQRMANGTLRRYVVSKKRSFSTSWDNLPDVSGSFLANGQAGNWMEQFHDEVNGEFLIRLRSGKDQGVATGDLTEEFSVMISEFSKDVTKRGKTYDLWQLTITLEEV